ncbi:hypothetical protein, partial [Massilia sp. CT11-108]|uniref:hypothetical protein n=1 Tax=Massilia sp. CT11-108 TaxID=3393900 RepID=UPI0039A66AB6
GGGVFLFSPPAGCGPGGGRPSFRRGGGRSDQFSLEMAEAMLFVEHGLDQVRQLPEDFGQHAEAVGQRLLALASGGVSPCASCS